MKLYKILIDPDIDNELSGMDAISLVDKPAVKYNFLAFSKDKQIDMKFNAVRKEISGVVCLADTPIFRYDKKHGRHYVVFDKETIRAMVLKYSKLGFNNNVNIQHAGGLIPNLTMVESYIKDSERGIAPIEFSDVPDGSWIVTFKVENEDVWNSIINGDNLNGFSLQGIFMYDEGVEYIAASGEETYEEWLKKIIS